MNIGSHDAARMERSAAILKEEGVPYNQYLPPVTESEAKLKTPEEIAQRLFAVYGVCVHSEMLGSGMTRKDSKTYLKKIDDILGGRLKGSLSPEERAFLKLKKPDQLSIAKFGWRYECCHVLMWALGMTDELDCPDQICDVSAMGEIIWRQESLKGFLERTKPRTRDEIMDAADLTLRYDWACVDARIKQQEPPAYLNDEVVVERHYAFNWLIGAYGDAGWDDISTDT